MTRYTVDRFEGTEWAVLEEQGGRTFPVPREWLPLSTREGDVLTVSEQASQAQGTTVRFELDASARDERLSAARRMREELPRGPKGDVAL